MAIFKATKTLQAIEKAMVADQGASFRQHLQKVLPHMSDAYRGEEENPFRMHLGSSVIGKECARAIWYGFRWADIPKFGGRMLRLFNRGHLEEARVISALLTIGVQVFQQDEKGKQFRISAAGGHFGGSGDGVGIGIPDVPEGAPCLLEFKTHNDTSFKKLQKVGVREAKFEHYVQMQTYMRKMGLLFALYGAVNKNDDDYWMEIVQLDTNTADQFLDRGQQLVFLRQAPAKIGNSPGWISCKWCDHCSVCHLGGVPARNCRTCKHSEPREDGTWFCGKLQSVLTEKDQLAGCTHYEVF